MRITKTSVPVCKFDLVTKKGVYPYEYIDSWERFEEKQLPPKEAFYSSLNDTTITDDDYEHAQNVWNTFECKNLGEYHDLYLKTDVLLLADVFENFRNKSLETHSLDPAHYFTLPGFSWDALLQHSEVELELLTDVDQHLFVEKGIRGGISMVSKRYAKANNKYIPDYNPDEPTSFIQYLDANNLYGWAMSQYLPVNNFKWSKTNLNKILNTKPDSDVGYILEVDLEYPKELHKSHNDYPLAPENLIPKKEWFSDYQLQLLGESPAPNIDKLTPNLMNKEKYVLHYRNLQLYLSRGLKVTKVHRILEFHQSPWMKSYIDLNTNLRKEAKSAFEKDMFKLMNNAVFGKTMENVRNRTRVELVRSNEDAKMRKLISKPTYASHKIFSMDLGAVHMHKTKTYLNKPITVGMAILDLSKWLMYDFYYHNLKCKYNDNVNLLYTDTDSLLLEIKTKDIYSDMAKDSNMYDTSNYPKTHSLFSEKNKKVVGKMKDECEGNPIIEYIGLRPKMYSILTLNDAHNAKRAKGVKGAVTKKCITHENYKEALFDKKTFIHGMNFIRSEGHVIYSQRVNKVSLSPLDTKRFIHEDGVHTSAYGFRSEVF